MPAELYAVMHVVSLMLLTGLVFYACAHPIRERRLTIAILSGLVAIVALVGGFGLQAKVIQAWPHWLFAKIVAWAALTLIAILVFRMPRLRIPMAVIALALVTAAAWLVYYKPDF